MQTQSQKGLMASFRVVTSQLPTSTKQLLSPTPIACGTKRYMKWTTLSESLRKSGFWIFALWALISFNGNAAWISPDASLSRSFNLTPQVWLEKGAHKLNVDSKGVILHGYDPVTYFTQQKAVKGNPKYQMTYQGATYYFSSAADLTTFKKDPAKYVPQYGGFCANAMSKRKANDIDPTVFFIVNAKLYVCSSPAAEKEFRSNETENIKRADENWATEDRWFY